MKTKVLLVLAAGAVSLAAVLLINTLRFTSKQLQVEPIPPVQVDVAGVARRLGEAIRFRTVSLQIKGDEFLGLHEYLARAFPNVHSVLTREVVGDYSLLYTWKGLDTGLKPILLMAHLDVVPVEPDTLAQWQHPPFEGRISDGYIWGRGALDDKCTVLGLMEAAEMLLRRGFRPRRTIYFAFGHDEEVGGNDGAAKMARLLRERNVEVEYVLDEGSSIIQGLLPGISQPVALIGIADKGYLSLELSVETASGHSGIPPPQTAIGILSTAISRLEARQMPAILSGVPRQTLETVGPEMGLANRVVMANLWLFKPLVERALAASPVTAQSIRTTTAATIIEGGIKENVLPGTARAVVNFRLRPGDNSERVLEHVREVVRDPRVKVNRFGVSNMEPSVVSDVNAPAYQDIQRTLRQVFPEIIVAPGQTIGATDSEHYAKLSKNVYRFIPLTFHPGDTNRVHGLNERASVDDYAASVRFYYQLISHSAQ